MEYKNTYNILDKLIAYLRNREVFNNNDLDNKYILDFGCGSDFNALKKRYEKTKETFLIDRCANSFREGKFTFVNYEDSIENLDNELKEKKFDIIIMCAIIEHLDHPEKIINYLKKYLTNDGYFFLTAPSVYSKPVLEFMGFKLGIINSDLLSEHKRYYNKKEYDELAKKTKLNLKKFYFFELKMNTAAILK
jgi:SAM-dependent methyltransferase